MSANKDLNRLKVVLVEKKKSSLWLSRQLGCAPTTVSKWCEMVYQCLSASDGDVSTNSEVVGGRISELVNSKFGDTI